MKAPYTGKNIIHLKEVHSTNSYTAEMLSNSAPIPEGSVIMADFQTAGKGQTGAIWESLPKENLLLSIYYRPHFLKIADQFMLSIAISLAICDFLKNYIEDVTIKWPNDIYVGNQKIAGVLIENSIQQDVINNSIIGIGLNINQKVFSTQAKNACSLSQLTGKEYDLQQMLQSLCECIEERYDAIKTEDYQSIRLDYLKQLYRLQHPANYMINGQVQLGTIEGIDEIGRLAISINGSIHYFNNKEITFII
ncbi:MAG: biotin--[acetyl-CoA-carboxylase] ligase [Sphingobacteriaceae bacterium]|jgi:BirA family biotin operon repressor/biotin-[acetyl-CoA-carboxylase] ligase